MMDEDYREVDFSKYCKTCKYKDLNEVESPCNECLEEPMVRYTNKPVNWKKANKGGK